MRMTEITLALIACATMASGETLQLSRTQAVQLALEQNESYQSALLEEDRISGQYLEARSGAFPRLTFESSYLRNIDLQTSFITMTADDGIAERFKLQFGTPHNYSMAFNLYQPLYAAGKVGSAIKIAGYGKKYTAAGIDRARHDVATIVDRAYLDAVTAREAELIYREAEQLADSNMAVVKKLYEQGQVSEFYYLRAQVQAANSRPDRIAADNRTRLAFDHLRNVLALSPDVEIRLASGIEEIKAPDLSLEELITEAHRNRPELHQSEQMVNIQKKMVSIASSGYRPNIGINSRIQWDSFTDEFKKASLSSDSWNRSWNVALLLSWPIFSGFETSGKIRQARVDYSQSRLANNQLVRQVRLEVQDARGKITEAKQRVEALGETVSQAERGVEIAQVRFKNGIGIQLELLDAQVALTTARVNRIAALHDLAVAVSELRRAVGREWAAQW
jgi:outer membrane protein